MLYAILVIIITCNHHHKLSSKLLLTAELNNSVTGAYVHTGGTVKRACVPKKPPAESPVSTASPSIFLEWGDIPCQL